MKKKEKPCPKCGEHCYAKLLNSQGEKVMREDEFCPKCNAHLAASGVCLNACSLSPASQERFARMLGAAAGVAKSRG